MVSVPTCLSHRVDSLKTGVSNETHTAEVVSTGEPNDPFMVDDVPTMHVVSTSVSSYPSKYPHPLDCGQTGLQTKNPFTLKNVPTGVSNHPRVKPQPLPLEGVSTDASYHPRTTGILNYSLNDIICGSLPDYHHINTVEVPNDIKQYQRQQQSQHLRLHDKQPYTSSSGSSNNNSSSSSSSGSDDSSSPQTDNKTPLIDICEKVLSEIQMIAKQMSYLPTISDHLKQLLEIRNVKTTSFEKSETWSDIEKMFLTPKSSDQGHGISPMSQTENHKPGCSFPNINTQALQYLENSFNDASCEQSQEKNKPPFTTNTNLVNLIELIDLSDNDSPLKPLIPTTKSITTQAPTNQIVPPTSVPNTITATVKPTTSLTTLCPTTTSNHTNVTVATLIDFSTPTTVPSTTDVPTTLSTSILKAVPTTTDPPMPDTSIPNTTPPPVTATPTTDPTAPTSTFFTPTTTPFSISAPSIAYTSVPTSVPTDTLTSVSTKKFVPKWLFPKCFPKFMWKRLNTTHKTITDSKNITNSKPLTDSPPITTPLPTTSLVPSLENRNIPLTLPSTVPSAITTSPQLQNNTCKSNQLYFPYVFPNWETYPAPFPTTRPNHVTITVPTSPLLVENKHTTFSVPTSPLPIPTFSLPVPTSIPISSAPLPLKNNIGYLLLPPIGHNPSTVAIPVTALPLPPSGHNPSSVSLPVVTSSPLISSNESGSPVPVTAAIPSYPKPESVPPPAHTLPLPQFLPLKHVTSTEGVSSVTTHKHENSQMALLSKKPIANHVNTNSTRPKEKFTTSKKIKSAKNSSQSRHHRDTYLSDIESSSDYESEAIGMATMATKYNRKRALNPQRHWDNDPLRDNKTGSSHDRTPLQSDNYSYNYSYNSHNTNVVNYQTNPQSRNKLTKPKELQRRPTSDEKRRQEI